MAQVVRCRAPRKNGRPCNAFVARVPWPFTAERVQHSSLAADDSHVSPCITCGALHEIRPQEGSVTTTSGVA